MDKVLITGVNGFVGEHVASAFQKSGFTTIGMSRQEQPHHKLDGILDDYVQGDLLDERDVARLRLTDVRAIIHLAGLADIGQSFEQPRRYITENPCTTFNLLAHAKNEGFSGRVVAVSTGALYDPRQPLPISETSPTSPSSPYAISKISAEQVTRYWMTRGVNAVVARPFNHIGPGQGSGFLVSDLYNELQRSPDAITVGNLETKRDYTDVRDVAAAYSALALAEHLQHDTYNVCSGRSLSGNHILRLLMSYTDTQNTRVDVDAKKIRPNDIMDIRGDSTRIRSELGWQPEYEIDQSIKDFIDSVS